MDYFIQKEMKPEEYLKLLQFAKVGENLVPANDFTRDFLQDYGEGEILHFKSIKTRDLSMHRCYFSLLNYIYSYMPDTFQRIIQRDNFYVFLKYYKNEIKIIFEFKNGIKIIEPVSISFANMDNDKFKKYVMDQMPFIYDKLIMELLPENIAKDVIETIEKDFESFFSILEQTKK